MRKAATQWAKATTAKTGVIDVNKLFSYKTNEDIFKQTTRLHDAQSHGNDYAYRLLRINV